MTIANDTCSGAASTASLASKTWDELAKLDPLWIILVRPGKKHGGWDPVEFFLTGEREISAILEKCAHFGIAPRSYDRVLDFGCGVGRLTRAWSVKFSHCVGVDVSAEMVRLAQQLNKGFPNCEFVTNDSDHLPFPDDSFDLVSSFIVLQHLSSQREILAWIAEFVRVLRPGGVIIFQLPDRPSFRRSIQGRRRLWALLRYFGLRESVLYEKLGLSPVGMKGIPPLQIREHMENLGMKILGVEEDEKAGAHYRSYTYFAQKT